MAIACLSACTKDDEKEEVPPVPDEYQLTTLIRDIDSVQFTYNTDGTVKQFAQFSRIGGFDDSTRVLYSNGKLSKFMLLEADGTATRTDIAFIYSGEQLIHIDYYNFGNDGTWQVTDHDSLVYKEGKLAECHRINGNFRNSFSKYTWENGNLVKDEQFSVINDQEVEDFYYSYTYSDKPNPYLKVKANFLFGFTRGNVTYLSQKEMVKWETTYTPSNVLAGWVTNVYEYDATTGMLKKVSSAAEDLLAGGTETVTTQYTYIKK